MATTRVRRAARKWRSRSRRCNSATSQFRSMTPLTSFGRSSKARATSPPPHVLYRGRASRSSSTTLRPRSASMRAAVAPAGPLPTTATSNMVDIKLARMPKLDLLVPLALIILCAAAACHAQQPAQGDAPMDMSAMDSADQHTSQAAHETMSGPMAVDPHMTMTQLRPANAADSSRAAALVRQIRVALDRYRDVRAAEGDGYRRFLPNVKQPIYHFTNRRWALAEVFRFDPAKPTSLLYRQEADGRFVLEGVMYSAPARTSLDE